MIKDLQVTSNGEKLKVPVKDILFIRSEDKYAMIHTKGKTYFGVKSVTKYHEDLPEFAHIHRGTIVNWDHVTGMKHGMLMVGTTPLDVSRRHVAAVRRKFVDMQTRDTSDEAPDA